MFSRSLRTILALSVVVALSFGFIRNVQPALAQDVCLGNNAAALTWMATLQNADGGFTNGFAPESNFGTTADTIFALHIVEADLATFVKEGKSPTDYLTAQVGAGNVIQAGLLGKLLLALASTDADPANYADHDLITETTAAVKALEDGSDLYSLSLGVLGLRAVGAEVAESAVTALTEARNEDGGWGFSKGTPSDTNTSSFAIQALLAIDPAFDAAPTLAYFKDTQAADKGWAYQKPETGEIVSDANSTAAVVQALIAAGENLSAWGSPEQTLASFQQEDGSFTYQLGTPAPSFLATIQALPVLCGATLIVKSDAVLATPEATPAS
jgi:hypothetical protein